MLYQSELMTLLGRLTSCMSRPNDASKRLRCWLGHCSYLSHSLCSAFSGMIGLYETRGRITHASFLYLCISHTSSIPPLWPLILMYCIWAFGFDTSPRRGGRPSEWFRNHAFWRYFAGYYPQKLLKVCNFHSLIVFLQSPTPPSFRPKTCRLTVLMSLAITRTVRVQSFINRFQYTY